MPNQDFLKTINILYVEDSKTIRNQMVDFFNKLFNNVIFAVDGEDGLEKFKNNDRIDVVVSDINMPGMDGLEMLAEIRKIDKEIPFIFTTAHSETEYALNAIKYGVSHYAVKPINMKELLLHIQEICTSKYQQKELKRTKIELERYIDVIEQVAIISKTDTQGKIIYANDMFCEVSKYSKDELVGKSHNIVRHPDMPSVLFESLWYDIKGGKTWKGKIKNRDKEGESYYVNATIFPIYDKSDTDDEIVEYIGISFITTEEEIERREFKKKVMHNFQESKRKDLIARTKINELEEEIKKYAHFDIIEDSLKQEHEKNKKLKNQIDYYEEKHNEMQEKIEKVTKDSVKKIAAFADMAKRAKVKSEKLFMQNTIIIEKYKKSTEELKRLNELTRDQAKIIENLRDVIEHREAQIDNLR